jgi:hypothetical protein
MATTDREAALRKIAVGDIFHASAKKYCELHLPGAAGEGKRDLLAQDYDAVGA